MMALTFRKWQMIQNHVAEIIAMFALKLNSKIFSAVQTIPLAAAVVLLRHKLSYIFRIFLIYGIQSSIHY